MHRAGALGAKVHVHLTSPNLEELRTAINAYREAWRNAGYDGRGHVTLTVPTFVGDDEDAVRELVREPMLAYLCDSDPMLRQAARSFEPLRERASGDKARIDALVAAGLDEAERNDLLEHAFDRFYDVFLFGTTDTCIDAAIERRDGANATAE